jgi:hypothetical protein
MQVTSIVSGGNSILARRNYDGGGIGSLAAGGTIVVKAPSAPEGDEHNGAAHGAAGQPARERGGLLQGGDRRDWHRAGVNLYGGDSYENSRARRCLREVPALLEAEVLTGVWNATNSLGTATATRTMQGIRGQLTSVNSTVVDASFSANPHLYIGDAMQNAFNNGAATTETWGIVAGPQYFRDISNLNDTKVQDSNRAKCSSA